MESTGHVAEDVVNPLGKRRPLELCQAEKVVYGSTVLVSLTHVRRQEQEQALRCVFHCLRANGLRAERLIQLAEERSHFG